MTALMAQELELSGTETVLEIGAGSGTRRQCWARWRRGWWPWNCCRDWRHGRAQPAKTGRGGNVTVVCGDGSQGYPEAAPYDGISVAAGAPDVPGALLEQLTEGGQPGDSGGRCEDQELRVIIRKGGESSSAFPTHCRFVPLRGHYGFR